MSRVLKYSCLAYRAALAEVGACRKKMQEAAKSVLEEYREMTPAEKFRFGGIPIAFAGLSFGVAYDIAHPTHNRNFPTAFVTGVIAPVAYYTSPLWLPVAAVGVPVGYAWRYFAQRSEKCSECSKIGSRCKRCESRYKD